MLLNGSLGGNLADPNTWTSSALHALKHLHEQLMQHYNCKEWAPPPNANAPAPGAPAPELVDNARPLSLPDRSRRLLLQYSTKMGDYLLNVAGSDDHGHIEDCDLEKHFKKQM